MKQIIFALLFCLCSGTAIAQSWQYNEQPVMLLGAGDKSSDSDVIIEFYVICPKGEKVTATAKSVGGDFGYVYFPGDFTGCQFSDAGNYKWGARIQGRPGAKALSSGKFTVKRTDDGISFYAPY